MRFHALGSFAVVEQSERRLPPLRSVPTLGLHNMSTFAKCSCQHCGNHIEFDKDCLGTSGASEADILAGTVACPHCGRDTTLVVPKSSIPPRLSPIPRKSFQVGMDFRKLEWKSHVLLIVASFAGAAAFLWGAIHALSTGQISAPARGTAVPVEINRSQSPWGFWAFIIALFFSGIVLLLWLCISMWTAIKRLRHPSEQLSEENSSLPSETEQRH